MKAQEDLVSQANLCIYGIGKTVLRAWPLGQNGLIKLRNCSGKIIHPPNLHTHKKSPLTVYKSDKNKKLNAVLAFFAEAKYTQEDTQQLIAGLQYQM